MTSATTESLAATQPGVGYSTGLVPGTPSGGQSTRTFRQNTCRQPIKAPASKKTSGTKHHDRGVFTMDCRLAVRRSNRGGDHCRKARYLHGYKSRMDKIKLPRCLLGAGTYDLNTDKGEVGGSSPPGPTIPFRLAAVVFSSCGGCASAPMQKSP